MPESQNSTYVSEAGLPYIYIAKGLESIVETIPDDLVSLEILAHVYEKMDDIEGMHKFLIRLGKAIVSDGDSELAEYIYDRIKNAGLFENMDDDLSALAEQLTIQKISDHNDPLDELVDSDSPRAFKVMDELSFAWRLFEAGELTHDEYAGVAHDLSEMTADGHLSTISVLHALNARSFSGMERVMGYIAHDAKVPIVNLELFDIQEPAYSLLPLDFMIRRGVLVYNLIGDDALVVVMNPIDKSLRRQIELQLNKVCHYYIALPADFDAVIASISEN